MATEITNALDIFYKNFERTDTLVDAMNSIKTQNSLYQSRLTNPDEYHTVKKIQDKQLKKYEDALGEHTIISLVIAFEAYWKALIKEFLDNYPKYFLDLAVTESNLVRQVRCYINLGTEFELGNRFEFFKFLEKFQIPFLDEELSEFIKYIHLVRNSYVHEGRTGYVKLDNEIAPAQFDINASVSTHAKKLRTKFSRIMKKANQRAIDYLVSS